MNLKQSGRPRGDCCVFDNAGNSILFLLVLCDRRKLLDAYAWKDRYKFHRNDDYTVFPILTLSKVWLFRNLSSCGDCRHTPRIIFPNNSVPPLEDNEELSAPDRYDH